MPITDDRTPLLNLPLPYADNMLEDDSDRIRSAFSLLDTAVAGKQANIGYTPENVAAKGVANGYAGLDAGGKVPASQLPSFVDDVVEVANYAALPAVGEAGKIYVTLAAGGGYGANLTYRWGGTTYVEIASSPGSTDVVPEGAVNLYHTPERALAAVPIATPVTLGKVKIGAGLGIDGEGLLFAAAGGGSVMTLVDVVPASNGVSSITVPGGYVVGAILVAFNGALLSPSDYTATTGATIGLVGFTAGTVDTFTVIKLATVAIGSLPAGSVGTTQLANGAVTYAKTTGIAKSGANTDITSIAGNAATVTNGVYTTGAQTITGLKTFSGGVRTNGPAILSDSDTGGVFSFEAPNLRQYIGDRTGYSHNLSSRVGGVTVDLKRITDTGEQSSVIPGGTVLYPEFACRAWVNFNGTGTVNIRASGNVSSVTDNGTGDYTVNFTTALPDTNYCVQRTTSTPENFGGYGESGAAGQPFGLLTTSVRVEGSRDSAGSRRDAVQVHVSVFR